MEQHKRLQLAFMLALSVFTFVLNNHTVEITLLKKNNIFKEGLIKVNKCCQKGTCNLGTSRIKLIEPDLVSSMSNWKFSTKRNCTNIKIKKNLPAIRSKLSLNCDGLVPYINISQTKSPTDIFNITFGDKCLSKFVDSCCTDEHPVPNVVHYVWWGDAELGYFNFLSFMSVLRFIKPCAILIHGPCLPYGPYWNYLLHLTPNIIHVYRERPTRIFGHKLAFETHSSDVMRIEALKEYGGIYLDFDQVILRPIDSLRRFRHTQGREAPDYLGPNVILSQRNSTFLHLWYLTYRDDYQQSWAHNALWAPNKIAIKHPELIHIEGFNFTRPSDFKIIFNENYIWDTNYGMHMFGRFYKAKITPNVIRTLNTTVGSVSRHVLYGNKELCVKQFVGKTFLMVLKLH